MLTSVHVAKVGPTGPLFRPPKAGSVPGLLSADAGMASPLGPGLIPKLDPTRVAMIAFWETEEHLDQFLETHPTGQKVANGWQARLEPLRAHGEWPGLPADLRRTRTVETDGPVVVTTLGKLKMTQAYRFFKTSALAESGLEGSDGLIWATGFGSPPFVATLSVWESAQAAYDYAYTAAQPQHDQAIDVDRKKGFHHMNAFIRYRPLSVSGALTVGRNPIPEMTIV